MLPSSLLLSTPSLSFLRDIKRLSFGPFFLSFPFRILRAHPVGTLTQPTHPPFDIGTNYLARFDGRGHDESIDAAHKRGECKVSPSRLKHQVFVLLYSLIEGCHEVRKARGGGSKGAHVFRSTILTVGFVRHIAFMAATSFLSCMYRVYYCRFAVLGLHFYACLFHA